MTTPAIKIVSAACRWNGIIFSMPAPACHNDILNTADRLIENDHFGIFLGYDQGFLGNDGLFYDRAAAREIVISNKQPLRDGKTSLDHPSHLFSEDLW